jgi:DNA-binding HxlR family transcriptional regulator
MRSYDQYCAVAKSLDVVGDRWTLLIVRELMLRGGCRYTDLRNGLPGIASNLLADRLRELEHTGVVEREDAPPPIATTLFHLTPRGEELRPVIDGLFRWGMPLMAEQKPDDAVHSHWLAGALEETLADQRPGEAPIEIELRTGDQPITIKTADGAVHTRLAPAAEPALTLTGEPRPVMGLVLGRLDLEAAQAAGVTYAGDPGALDRIRGDRPPVAAEGY